VLVYLWRLFRELSECSATFIHSGYERCGSCPPMPAAGPLVLGYGPYSLENLSLFPPGTCATHVLACPSVL
jgi:hypothetical protein